MIDQLSLMVGVEMAKKVMRSCVDGGSGSGSGSLKVLELMI